MRRIRRRALSCLHRLLEQDFAPKCTVENPFLGLGLHVLETV
jgi:hypothetical protein